MNFKSIGIDISNDVITFIELTRQAGKLWVSRTDSKRYTEIPVAKRWWQKIPIVMAVPTAHVLQKIIRINPAMTVDEIYYYLKTEANHYFSHPDTALLIDFVSLNHDTNAHEIVAFATLKNKLKETLIASIIDIECYAVWRLICYCEPSIDFQKTTGILRQTSTGIQLSIMKNHQLLFFREEKPLNDAAIIHHWIQSFSISHQEKINQLCLFEGENLELLLQAKQHFPSALKIINHQLFEHLNLKPAQAALATGLALRGFA